MPADLADSDFGLRFEPSRALAELLRWASSRASAAAASVAPGSSADRPSEARLGLRIAPLGEVDGAEIVRDVGAIGSDGGRLLETRCRLRESPGSLLREAEQRPGAAVPGTHLHRDLGSLERLSEVPGGECCLRELHRGLESCPLRVRRVELDRLAQTRGHPLEVAEAALGGRELEPERGGVRVQLRGLEEDGDGVHPALGADVGAAELGGDLGVAPVELVRRAQRLEPAAGEALLLPRQAEIEPDPGIARH